MMASADQIVEAVVILLLFAHIGAFVWAGWLRKGITFVLALNAIVSAGVVIYWAPHIGDLLRYADAVLAFVGFEIVVLATSLFAIAHVRVPRALIWFEFTAHMLFVMATLAFLLTFKIDRLI